MDCASCRPPRVCWTAAHAWPYSMNTCVEMRRLCACSQGPCSRLIAFSLCRDLRASARHCYRGDGPGGGQRKLAAHARGLCEHLQRGPNLLWVQLVQPEGASNPFALPYQKLQNDVWCSSHPALLLCTAPPSLAILPCILTSARFPSCLQEGCSLGAGGEPLAPWACQLIHQDTTTSPGKGLKLEMLRDGDESNKLGNAGGWLGKGGRKGACQINGTA